MVSFEAPARGRDVRIGAIGPYQSRGIGTSTVPTRDDAE